MGQADTRDRAAPSYSGPTPCQEPRRAASTPAGRRQTALDNLILLYREHPDVGIVPVNDNPVVKRMIARAQSAPET